ncbi:hypothetical protein [Streptomyces sp. NPDC000880]
MADSWKGTVVVERSVKTPIAQPELLNRHSDVSPLRRMNTSAQGAAALVRPWNPELADFMAAMEQIEADYARRCTT